MNIVPYQPGHLPGLYDIYHRVTAKVPHSRFIPSMAYTGEALDRAMQAGSVVLVAEEQDTVCGIATHGSVTPTEDGTPQMEITSLFAPQEATINALLQACLLRAEGAQRITAFPTEHGRCPLPAYNGGWDGLSDQLRPVARTLARHGFAPTYRELHLECSAPHFPPVPLPAPSDVSIVEKIGPKYQSVRVMQGDEEIGICLWMRLSKISDHPEAHAWAYVDWLHVEEAQRRRGLGRYLMNVAMLRMAEQGCRGCWLTTGGDNWPAQPLYLSLGFEILDTSSSWIKTIR